MDEEYIFEDSGLVTEWINEKKANNELFNQLQEKARLTAMDQSYEYTEEGKDVVGIKFRDKTKKPLVKILMSNSLYVLFKNKATSHDTCLRIGLCVPRLKYCTFLFMRAIVQQRRKCFRVGNKNMGPMLSVELPWQTTTSTKRSWYNIRSLIHMITCPAQANVSYRETLKGKSPNFTFDNQKRTDLMVGTKSLQEIQCAKRAYEGEYKMFISKKNFKDMMVWREEKDIDSFKHIGSIDPIWFSDLIYSLYPDEFLTSLTIMRIQHTQALANAKFSFFAISGLDDFADMLIAENIQQLGVDYQRTQKEFKHKGKTTTEFNGTILEDNIKKNNQLLKEQKKKKKKKKKQSETTAIFYFKRMYTPQETNQKNNDFLKKQAEQKEELSKINDFLFDDDSNSEGETIKSYSTFDALQQTSSSDSDSDYLPDDN